MVTEHNVKKALDEHGEKITSLPNVVGIGMVEASDTQPEEGMAVAVYVNKKIPKTELDESALVPKELETICENKQVSVPTRVVEIKDVGPGFL